MLAEIPDPLDPGIVKMRTKDQTMPAQRRFSDEDRRQAVEMFRAGVKLTKIEAETGMSRATIYTCIREEGLEPRRQQKRTHLKHDPAQTLEFAFDRLLQLQEEVGRLKRANEDLRAEIERLRLQTGS